MNNVNVDLLHYNSILKWRPQHGDLITRHRLMSWWGVVIGVDNVKETVLVIRAANPQTLMTMGKLEQDKRTVEIDVSQIKSSKGYAIQQVYNGQAIWYLS